MGSGSAFDRLALGFRTGGLRGVGGGAACCRTLYAGRRTQGAGRSETGNPWRWNAVDPGFHGVPRGLAPDPGGGAGELGVAGTG